jgi:HlyD family secretion protein
MFNDASEGKVYVESVAVITGLGSANGTSNRYTGEVEAQESWKISLQYGLSVAKCYVNVGDEVKEGDELFSYNTEEMKLNKEKKELEVETLTNEMNQLKKDIAGYENDLKNASASEKIELQTQILTAQTTIKKDEFTIKSAKEEIESLNKNINDATIKSKMAGVVKKINASLGTSSGDTDSDSSGSVDDDSGDNVYMTILALGDYRVKGKVSESNVWSLNEGDPVIVRSRVDKDQTWRGSISEVKTDQNADAETTDNSESDYDYGDTTGESASKYNFFVKLDDDTGLMMGQHVLIELDNGQEEDREGIWLNTAYLHIDGDNYYVWAANSRDRLTLRKVTVGEYNEALDEYEIVKGLSIKDYIASDSEDLHENMRVTRNASEAENTEYYEEEENDDDIMVDGGDQEFDDGADDGLFEDVDSFDGGDNGDGIVDGGSSTGTDDGSGLGPDQLNDGNTTNQNEDGV